MKFHVTDLSTVPEALRSEYEQREGGYFLKVEGEIPTVVEATNKLKEFRDTNIGLIKKTTELENSLKRFEGIEPEKYREYKTRVESFEQQGGVKTPSEIEARINAAVAPLQQQLADMQKKEQEANEKLARRDLETKLRETATKAGVAETAISDFISRGMGVFNLEGKAMSGDTPIWSKKDATKPMSMEEWAGNLLSDAPHLFKASGGGGARGGNPNPAGNATGVKFISGDDPLEFGRNAEAIAKGEVVIAKP